MSTLPALRLYWFDSARDGVPDAEKNRIGELDGVKLRWGRCGVDGQQKGVDLRIGLDLEHHARRRTAEVFFLVASSLKVVSVLSQSPSRWIGHIGHAPRKPIKKKQACVGAIPNVIPRLGMDWSDGMDRVSRRREI